MDNSQTISQTNQYRDLKRTFDTWDKDKLIQYALSITKAISVERESVRGLSSDTESAQTRLRDMALVERIGQDLASTLDLDEVLERLLGLINQAVDVEDGSILLTDEASGDLVVQTSLGAVSEEIKPLRVPKGQGIAGEVAQTGRPIRIENAQQDERHFKQPDHDTGFLTRSILCVPMKRPNKVIGVIEVFNKKTGPFTENDERLLSSIANYAAISIENARLHRSVIDEKDRVIQAQEEVSHRLQRDLHDGPTQLVAATQMGIEFCLMAIQRHNGPANVELVKLIEPELMSMHELSDRTMHQMRTLLFQLRPLVLETLGFIPALETFIERRQKEGKTRIHLQINSDQADNHISRLQTKYEGALFAIVQEAVNNSLKYARADNIFIRLYQRRNRLVLTVLDDGLGFNLDKINKNYESRGSYGMVNQQERAALVGSELVVKSAPGAGAELTVDITLTPGLLQGSG